MPHLSCLGCEPACHGCVNGAAGARSKFRRTGVQHGVQKRCRLCAILLPFRPPTVSVATRTLPSGARRNGRRAETQVEAAGKHRHLSLGRPSRSLPELRAAPGVGGLPSGNERLARGGGAPVPPALLAKGNQTGPVSSPVPVQGPPGRLIII
jgi:hypothetical protein